MANRGNVALVCGAQYGSEGKGKVVKSLVDFLQTNGKEVMSIRCGGPNSGHTVTRNGEPIILKALPSAVFNCQGPVCIPAGAVIDPDLLQAEISMLGLKQEDFELIIDPMAVLLSEEDKQTERHELKERIASTASGNGEALVRRMRRRGDVCLARDKSSLHHIPGVRIDTVSGQARSWIKSSTNENADHRWVVIEGNQGYGLSLLHGPHYPNVTSRDVTPAGFMSECGLPPTWLTHTIAVMRTFPIRVGGNSGPLENEISWKTVAEMGSWPEAKEEITSVSKTIRRVGRIDWDWMTESFKFLQPTQIACMGYDRLDYDISGSKNLTNSVGTVPFTVSRFNERLASSLYVADCPAQWEDVLWFGTGPTDLVERSMQRLLWE